MHPHTGKYFQNVCQFFIISYHCSVPKTFIFLANFIIIVQIVSKKHSRKGLQNFKKRHKYFPVYPGTLLWMKLSSYIIELHFPAKQVHPARSAKWNCNQTVVLYFPFIFCFQQVSYTSRLKLLLLILRKFSIFWICI